MTIPLHQALAPCLSQINPELLSRIPDDILNILAELDTRGYGLLISEVFKNSPAPELRVLVSMCHMRSGITFEILRKRFEAGKFPPLEIEQ